MIGETFDVGRPICDEFAVNPSYLYNDCGPLVCFDSSWEYQLYHRNVQPKLIWFLEGDTYV